MKTIILLSTLAIIGSGIHLNISAQNINDDTLSAIEHCQARINIDTNNMVAVTYHGKLEDDGHKLAVRIYDEAGNRIYFRHLKRQGTARIRFDLSQCDDGTYEIELYDHKKLICSKAIRKETQVHTSVLMSAL